MCVCLAKCWPKGKSLAFLLLLLGFADKDDKDDDDGDDGDGDAIEVGMAHSAVN